MEIVDEKYVEMSYEELNLKEKDLDALCDLGLDLIKDDRKYLIDYTINRLMIDILEKVHPDTNHEEKVDLLKSYIKIRI